MTDTTQERPASLLDDTGTIESFLACRRCAHNLRGQPSAGRCPQCGAAIGLSRAGDLLRYADPAWVDRMARGLRFVLLGLTLTVLWSALVALLTIHPLLGRPVLVVGGLLALHGVWLLTTSEPHSLDERRYARLRRTIRFALLIGLLNSPGSIVLPSDGLTPVVAICLAIVMFIGGAATAIGELAKLRYLERLATRLPDATLARHAAFLRWSLPGAIGLKVILTNATLVLGSFAAAAAHAPSSALSRMTCFFGVAELAALLLLLVYLHLQYQLMRAFCRQAQWARATWATGSGNQGGAANVTAEPSGE